MLGKHWQFQILLAVLVGIHAFCPLFCEAFGQKLCSDSSESIQMMNNETGSSCCNKTNPGTTDESKEKTACCINSLDLILTDASFNSDTIRESLGTPLVSNVTLTAISPQNREKSQSLPPVPKLFSSILNNHVSHRGPPYTRS